jgi:hypothetical protein
MRCLAPRSGARAAAGASLAAGSFVLLFAATASASPSTTSPEQGYDLGEVQSPRAVGMGGALNALGTSTTALYLNPANMALARVYHFEALGAFSPEARRQSYGGAVIDSLLNRAHLAGGVAANWSMLDPDGIQRAWTDVRAALGYPLGDFVSLGVTGRYLRVEQSIGSGPFGLSLASGGTAGQPLFNQVTFDAGATITPFESLRLGVVGHNLTNPGTGFAPTTLAGGIGWFSHEFTIEGDALADFTTWGTTKSRLMLGGEYFAANRYPIRIGYRYDDGTKTHAVSGGLGYIDRKWSIEVSGRHDVAGNHPATMISISLRYFYDPTGGMEEGADAF